MHKIGCISTKSSTKLDFLCSICAIFAAYRKLYHHGDLYSTIRRQDLVAELEKDIVGYTGIKIIQHREKKNDSTLMSGEELDAKIDRAHKELRDGRYTEFSDAKEMDRWLDTL